MTRPDGFDRIGAGVVAGAFLGGAVGLLAHTLVGTALKLDTQAAFQSLIVGFAAKAAGAILPWAVLSFLPQAQPLAHPVAYLIAYASTILIVLGGGLFDHLRLSNEIAAQPSVFESGSASGGESTSSDSIPSGSSPSLESAS